MVNGIINVYKEKGFTSFDVVAKMRGIFHQKKIGHTGTLDPDAEGVLPICLGKATRVCDLLTEKDKEYEAVLLLGQETDTQDTTGEILNTSDQHPEDAKIREAILSFVGAYEQVPPMYSALKVNGQKLCDLARKGITVERKARPVQIHEIEILSVAFPEVTMRVHCSKGTYIRTLCKDIGDKLGCYGCMKQLKRTRVAGFTAENAHRISEVEALVKAAGSEVPAEQWNYQLFSSFLDPVDSVFGQYQKAVVQLEAQKQVRNGNRIPEIFLSGQPASENGDVVRLYDWNDGFIGLYTYQKEEQEYKPLKLFME